MDNPFNIFFQQLKIEIVEETTTAVVKALLSQKEGKEESVIYLNRKEAAKLLSCSLTTLSSYQKKGYIPFYRIGRKVYFKKGELLNLDQAIIIRKGVRNG